MEKPVVRLEIPLEWNLWRIYRIEDPDEAEDEDEDEGPDEAEAKVEAGSWIVCNEWIEHESRRWFVRNLDPMDQDGFNDATSYPALKPDLDIFGAPAPCRKQRGWYHVRRWPPITRTSYGGRQMKYATGVDIPSELINMVVGQCSTYRDEWTKTEIWVLRLVCRRWENLFLANMFNSVSAGSTQRITDLETLQTKRLALGWRAFPISISKWELKLDRLGKMRSWVQAVIRLRRTYGQELSIKGPAAPGQRLTSVHLSSPCRAPWNPFRMFRIIFTDVHFKKPSDLIRLLRELPFLIHIWGEKVTWDASKEEYPGVMSYIPRKDPLYFHDDIQFGFTDSQRGITGILSCALTPAYRSPISQSDAEALYRLSASFDLPYSALLAKGPMNLRWTYRLGGVNSVLYVCLERMDTRPQVCVVRYLVFNFVDTSSIPSMPWESIVTSIENLSTQPKGLLVFHSASDATLSSQHLATVPKIASLYASNRLIYALQREDEKSLSVVMNDGDGGWIILARATYDGFNDRNPDSYLNVLRRLAMRPTNH